MCCRAEGLAAEIKDLQGQLADYNMVNRKYLAAVSKTVASVLVMIWEVFYFLFLFMSNLFSAGGQAQHQHRDGGDDQ